MAYREEYKKKKGVSITYKYDSNDVLISKSTKKPDRAGHVEKTVFFQNKKAIAKTIRSYSASGIMTKETEKELRKGRFVTTKTIVCDHHGRQLSFKTGKKVYATSYRDFFQSEIYNDKYPRVIEQKKNGAFYSRIEREYCRVSN